MIELIYYRHNNNQPQAELVKNKISFNELTIVLKGQLDYTINGKKTPLSSGDVIFVKSGSVRYREKVENTEYVSFNFLSDQEFDLLDVLKGGTSDVIYQIINVFDSIYKYTTNLLDERFTLLLSCLIKQLKVQRKVLLKPTLVNQIEEFIRLNLDKKISLSDISELTHYSISHCEMIFNKWTGCSITVYIIKKRIEKAKSLLTEMALTLNQVAEAVGFSDYNFFSRTFKKETGVSPLVYRNTYFM
ncbi:MAG: helix-turn-helix transcriptional regulator [Clostridia bacterium]|nr:helix-turn-helix transcriptional regulator [Clostridia bacterium]